MKQVLRRYSQRGPIPPGFESYPKKPPEKEEPFFPEEAKPPRDIRMKLQEMLQTASEIQQMIDYADKHFEPGEELKHIDATIEGLLKRRQEIEEAERSVLIPEEELSYSEAKKKVADTIAEIVDLMQQHQINIVQIKKKLIRLAKVEVRSTQLTQALVKKAAEDLNLTKKQIEYLLREGKKLNKKDVIELILTEKKGAKLASLWDSIKRGLTYLVDKFRSIASKLKSLLSNYDDINSALDKLEESVIGASKRRSGKVTIWEYEDAQDYNQAAEEPLKPGLEEFGEPSNQLPPLEEEIEIPPLEEEETVEASKRISTTLPPKAKQVMDKAIKRYFPNITEKTKRELIDSILMDYEESDINQITVHDVVEIFDASGLDPNDEAEEVEASKRISQTYEAMTDDELFEEYTRVEGQNPNLENEDERQKRLRAIEQELLRRGYQIPGETTSKKKVAEDTIEVGDWVQVMDITDNVVIVPYGKVEDVDTTEPEGEKAYKINGDWYTEGEYSIIALPGYKETASGKKKKVRFDWSIFHLENGRLVDEDGNEGNPEWPSFNSVGEAEKFLEENDIRGNVVEAASSKLKSNSSNTVHLITFALLDDGDYEITVYVVGGNKASAVAKARGLLKREGYSPGKVLEYYTEDFDLLDEEEKKEIGNAGYYIFDAESRTSSKHLAPGHGVVDEALWEKAKKSVDKKKYKGDDYWAVVQHVYQNMGGKYKKKKSSKKMSVLRVFSKYKPGQRLRAKHDVATGELYTIPKDTVVTVTEIEHYASGDRIVISTPDGEYIFTPLDLGRNFELLTEHKSLKRLSPNAPDDWPDTVSLPAIEYISSMVRQVTEDEGVDKLTAERLAEAVSEDSGQEITVDQAKKWLDWYKAKIASKHQQQTVSSIAREEIKEGDTVEFTSIFSDPLIGSFPKGHQDVVLEIRGNKIRTASAGWVDQQCVKKIAGRPFEDIDSFTVGDRVVVGSRTATVITTTFTDAIVQYANGQREKVSLEAVKKVSDDLEELYTKFPNLRRFDEPTKEIARSILNNGFLTIAHNWKSQDRRLFTELFTSLGASPNFLEFLNDMFRALQKYETSYDEAAELAWEDMVEIAQSLDALAKQEGLYDKLDEMIGWSEMLPTASQQKPFQTHLLSRSDLEEIAQPSEDKVYQIKPIGTYYQLVNAQDNDDRIYVAFESPKDAWKYAKRHNIKVTSSHRNEAVEHQINFPKSLKPGFHFSNLSAGDKIKDTKTGEVYTVVSVGADSVYIKDDKGKQIEITSLQNYTPVSMKSEATFKHKATTIGSPEWVDRVIKEADEHFQLAKIVPDRDDYILAIQEAAGMEGEEIDYQLAETYYNGWTQTRTFESEGSLTSEVRKVSKKLSSYIRDEGDAMTSAVTWLSNNKERVRNLPPGYIIRDWLIWDADVDEWSSQGIWMGGYVGGTVVLEGPDGTQYEAAIALTIEDGRITSAYLIDQEEWEKKASEVRKVSFKRNSSGVGSVIKRRTLPNGYVVTLQAFWEKYVPGFEDGAVMLTVVVTSKKDKTFFDIVWSGDFEPYSVIDEETGDDFTKMESWDDAVNAFKQAVEKYSSLSKSSKQASNKVTINLHPDARLIIAEYDEKELTATQWTDDVIIEEAWSLGIEGDELTPEMFEAVTESLENQGVQFAEVPRGADTVTLTDMGEHEIEITFSSKKYTSKKERRRVKSATPIYNPGDPIKLPDNSQGTVQEVQQDPTTGKQKFIVQKTDGTKWEVNEDELTEQQQASSGRNIISKKSNKRKSVGASGPVKVETLPNGYEVRLEQMYEGYVDSLEEAGVRLMVIVTNEDDKDFIDIVWHGAFEPYTDVVTFRGDDFTRMKSWDTALAEFERAKREYSNLPPLEGHQLSLFSAQRASKKRSYYTPSHGGVYPPSVSGLPGATDEEIARQFEQRVSKYRPGIHVTKIDTIEYGMRRPYKILYFETPYTTGYIKLQKHALLENGEITELDEWYSVSGGRAVKGERIKPEIIQQYFSEIPLEALPNTYKALLEQIQETSSSVEI